MDKSLLSTLFEDALSEAELRGAAKAAPRKSFVESLEEELAEGGPGALSNRFIVPPFSVVDARHERWQRKQTKWIPVFDPLLCEIVYQWFAPRKGGHILDPFGDATRGIVAGCLGYNYTGIERNEKKIAANERQAMLVQQKYPGMKLPNWICGAPESLERHLPAVEQYDLIFTNLPIYDSRHTVGEYATGYKSILSQAVARLKQDRFVVVMARVVRAEVFIQFTPEDVTAFLKSTVARYYNRIALAMSGNTHESLLCFFKGNTKHIPQALGVLNGVSKNRGVVSVPASKPSEQRKATGETVCVKISAASARLRFHGCDADYIRNVCHGRCCETSTKVNGKPVYTRVPVQAAEAEKLLKYDVKIENGLLKPDIEKKRCPLKTDEGFCGVHGTEDKPFGCIASPFCLNQNDTLVIRNRYKLLCCYDAKPRIPAYKAFRASLDQFFGNQEAERICNHLEAGGGDIHAEMLPSAYRIHKGNEESLK